jgi:hypothetical protein
MYPAHINHVTHRVPAYTTATFIQKQKCRFVRVHENMMKSVHRVQCQENMSWLTLNYNETIAIVAIYS